MATLPYSVFIAPSDIPSASSGTWTLSVQSTMLGGMKILGPNTQNSYIEWPVLVAAGTYRLTLVYPKNNDYGIVTVALDGATLGTIDEYAASGSANSVTQISDIAITAGLHLLRFTMATKNASSGAYHGNIQAISLLRTGA